MKNRTIKQLLTTAAGLTLAATAQAQFSNYTPLTSSAGPIPVNDPSEATPITLSSPNFTQVSIADRTNQNTISPGSNSGNWDMITANETGPDAGRYLLMPFETATGGVQRIDLQDPNYNTRAVTIVAPGTSGFVAGDASRWTPWGSYLTAEESWATGSTKGRLFEVDNATTAPANGGSFLWRSIVPRVSHEGLAFDSNNAMYFIDELNGGAIYKYVSQQPNATTGANYFAAGQSFALRVGAGGQFEGNNAPAITGAASWVAITDAAGAPLPFATLNLDVTIDGRATADHASVLSTGYNRPEDMEIQNLGNGDQLLYWTTTDSDNDANSGTGTSRVYHLNLSTLQVSLFADSSITLDLATNNPVGVGLRSADNLAIDAENNMYIIEDRNGGVDDDIWFANDVNKDGDLLDAGEGIGRWASNGTQGSEFTGLYFDKFNPNRAYVNIQHPTSGNDRTIVIDAVPEPSTVASAILGGAGMLLVMRRRRRA